MKNKRIIIELFLLIIIVALGYLSVRSIQKPIEFKEFKKERYTIVKQKLEDIREAQMAYKKVHNKFAENLDVLVDFVKYDSIPFMKKIGELSDSLLEAGWTEARAIKEGIIVREESKSNVLETIFDKDYNIDDLPYIPFTNKKERFEMGATIIETSAKVKVPVFEVKAHNSSILNGFEDPSLITNLNVEEEINNQYPGLKIGSLTEANNSSANW